MMKIPLVLIALFPITSVAVFGQTYFISVPNEIGRAEQALDDYPGSYWGKTESRIYLSGNEDDLSWLNYHAITYQARPIGPHVDRLYICYLDSRTSIPESVDILDRGPDYLVTESPLPGASFYRQLIPSKMPSAPRPDLPPLSVTYDPQIDSLMDQVSLDSLFDCVGRLSGELPIEIDGRLDTLMTRNSWTADNRLATRFLKGKLENYGYDVELLGVYGVRGRGVTVISPSIALMITETSDILRTTDGGTNWAIVREDWRHIVLSGIAHVGDNSVWVTGGQGTLLYSSDGGASFNPRNPGIGGGLAGICFVDYLNGWIAVEGGVLRTTNGGTSWTMQPFPDNPYMADIDFIDLQNGWVVGWRGLIFHTEDGGETWFPQTSGVMVNLGAVDFINGDTGWAVGDIVEGSVVQTTNGGSTWRQISVGANGGLTHIDFADSRFGTIVGNDGLILTTSDAGASWHADTLDFPTPLFGVELFDSLTQYAVGSELIEKSTDGGLTWIDQLSGAESAWRDVIVTKPGTVLPDEQVIICAHFDSRVLYPEDRAPGADDNASGTAAVVEAARILSNVDFAKTVKFCLWTGEETGCMGSAIYAYWAHLRHDFIVGVFNYDMIAWDGNSDTTIELHCGTMPLSIRLGQIFQGVVEDYGIDLNPDLITRGSTDRSDHASFWYYNYPAILGIEDFTDDLNPFHHTIHDSLTYLDSSYYWEYAKAALGTVATLAADTTPSTAIRSQEPLPGGFALVQNYPNPFNAQTTIKYFLPNPSDVEIAIYDILGRRVGDIAQGMQPAGEHRITWNAIDKSSGIYFYKIKAGDLNETRKMLLLK